MLLFNYIPCWYLTCTLVTLHLLKGCLHYKGGYDYGSGYPSHQPWLWFFHSHLFCRNPCGCGWWWDRSSNYNISMDYHSSIGHMFKRKWRWILSLPALSCHSIKVVGLLDAWDWRTPCGFLLLPLILLNLGKVFTILKWLSQLAYPWPRLAL